MSENKSNKIIDRLEKVLVNLKHRGVRDTQTIKDIEDSISDLKQTK